VDCQGFIRLEIRRPEGRGGSTPSRHTPNDASRPASLQERPRRAYGTGRFRTVELIDDEYVFNETQGARTRQPHVPGSPVGSVRGAAVRSGAL